MSTIENSDDTNDFHIPNQTNSIALKNLHKKIKLKDKQCNVASGRDIVAVHNDYTKASSQKLHAFQTFKRFL